MSTSTRTTPGRRSAMVAGLVLVILGIAAGHLYVIPQFDRVHLGLPLWMWIQLGLIGCLFVIAWGATVLTSSGRRA